MLNIFVDGDACPVKKEVYMIAKRHDLRVILVSNQTMRDPQEGWIQLVIVGDELDEADDWIVNHVEADDIIISADIPLADRCLKRGACVLGPTGRPFTENNIGEALATRNLLTQLHESGTITGGPAPFKKEDRSRFLHSLDEMIQSIRRRRGLDT
jgi:hypothetical protein